MSTALLLVDNSNTRTKFALLPAGGSLESAELRTCPTADLCRATLRRVLAGWVFSRALLCSVAPRAAAVLRAELGCPVSELHAARCPHLLRGYASPLSLGADRVANAAALAAHYPLPCVAVDPGTACTFDLVVPGADGPRFAGGAISPGLLTSARALAQHTAKLPLLTPAELRTLPAPGALGQNTRQALLAGLVFGFRGMVRGILEEMASSLGERPGVVLTGGDAALLPPLPGWRIHTDKLLTFKGLLATIA